jgi:CRISPR-associated helicase Cas3/CRISPR-associated endonuclease Cas3-HD
MVGYPLADCWARPPDEAGREHLLADHLRAVAAAMGRPDGDYGKRLRFLAGLLHDAGKASERWQKYIRSSAAERCKGGVPHAFAGAMLFALLLEELLAAWRPAWREKKALLAAGLSLVYFIYHHHGPVPDTVGDYPPWQGEHGAEELFTCDLQGIFALASGYFPELARLEAALVPSELSRKLAGVAAAWKKWQDAALDHIAGELERGNRFAAGARICVVKNRENHRLITGDRLHAAGIDPSRVPGETITAPEAEAALERLETFCAHRKENLHRDGARGELLEMREKSRRAALTALRRNPDARFFTLELPTGYGKTLTALSVGLAAVAAGRASRLIYVAPYLSILSQAAAEISAATGLEILVHHHLAALEKLPAAETDPLEAVAMDTWSAPVVATTYNQFFRALFPERGQHTVRLKGLQGAFVIVDEPQTVAATSWVPFLAVTEAAAQELDCRFLFTTATLPELSGGVFELEPVSLGREDALFDRYRVQSIGSLAEDQLAEKVVETFRVRGATTVIQNTIQDAALVYDRIKALLREDERRRLYFLSGRLTPLHKRARLAEIRRVLDAKEPALVVSTQVLEAGVDLSFRVVFRARPLFPSVIQAAGRCNRHGEGETEPGAVYLFDFRRGGTEDTRRYIYRDVVRREVTDVLLQRTPAFEERASGRLIRDYYRECFRRNPHQGALQKIEAAAYGHWRELAGIDPFGPEHPTCGVFVPRSYDKVPEVVRQGLDYFAVGDPEALWTRYTARGFLGTLDFEDRRRFMALMYQFLVPVPVEVAREVGEPVADRTLLRLRYATYYREDIGLSLVAPADEPLSEQFI